jgi:hypothetical protein
VPLDVDRFVEAQKRVWGWIEGAGVGKISTLAKQLGSAYDKLVHVFKASMVFTAEVASKHPGLRHAPRLSLLGLHVAMYHTPAPVLDLVEDDETPEERTLSEILGLDTEDLRDCLVASFASITRLAGLREGKLGEWSDKCDSYWRRGVVLPHLGALLHHRSGDPPRPSPRLIATNALVPWLLNVLRDMASGSTGAGSIAVVGASIGKGKTTTLYYTLRSVLYALHPVATSPGETMMDVKTEADEVIPYVMLLDPYDFLTAVQALAESGVKAPILVVDNASVIFPKQWVRIGGPMHKFYLRMNTVIDLLRGVCGAVIFVANAPDELASFIRNAASINISGREEPGIKGYSVTVYTWRRPSLRVSADEERVKMRERIASVYAYPLLKLPQELYARDLKVKLETIARETVEAIKQLKEGARKRREEEDQA